MSVAITGYELIPAGPPDSVAYVVGELLNAGPGPIENARVTISFLDATGRVVATQVTPTDFRVILAQERVPFAVPLFQMSAQWTSLQAQVSAAPASPEALSHSHRELVAEQVIFN